MKTKKNIDKDKLRHLNTNIYSSGFGGGGGFPLCTSLRYPFLVTDPKNFLKVPWAPIYTNFERGARAEKTQFLWSKFSKKCLKTHFWPFFKNLPAALKFSSNLVFYSGLRALRKSI